MKKEDLKVGGVYKNVASLVVVCTGTGVDERFFEGIVIHGDFRKTGHNGNCWSIDSFEPYETCEPKDLGVEMKNDTIYKIPSGCKATIHNGSVIISDLTKYYVSYHSDSEASAVKSIDKNTYLSIDVSHLTTDSIAIEIGDAERYAKLMRMDESNEDEFNGIHKMFLNKIKK